MTEGEQRQDRRVDVSVVIPAFNEHGNLRALVDELFAVLSALERTSEVIIVDDGSADGSRDLLRELAAERPGLRVIVFRRNFGQTAAFDAGFRNARGDIIVTMDADRQNDPADIPRLLAKLNDGFDLVSGWRRERRDGFWLRRLPSRLANGLVRWVTGAPVHDLGCSLKAYRRDIAVELRLFGEMHRFIVPLADAMGARIAEIEVSHRPRTAGTSKYGLDRTLKVAFDLLTVWFVRGYQTKPLYVFGSAGLALLAAGGATAAYVVWQKLALEIWVHRNPLFMVAILFTLVGVQAIGIGLIAEVLVRTYFEAAGRRAYSIAEIIDAGDPSAGD